MDHMDNKDKSEVTAEQSTLRKQKLDEIRNKNTKGTLNMEFRYMDGVLGCVKA